MFAKLACLVGKKKAARWGTRRCTISGVGTHNGVRFVMATFADGSVVMGEPRDFSVPPKHKNRKGAVDAST